MRFHKVTTNASKSEDEDKEIEVVSPKSVSRIKQSLKVILKGFKRDWLYIVSLALFVIGFWWFADIDLVIPVTNDLDANNLFRIYGSLSIISMSGIIPLLLFMNRNLSEPEKLSPITPSEGAFKADYKFLIARSDNLDREIHYLRSGISLLAGVFTVIIAWLLDFGADRVLSLPEINLIIISSILVIFSILAILFSFGVTAVYSHGHYLYEDLVPDGQSKSTFTVQLKAAVSLKREKISRMKNTVALGFVLFLLFGGYLIFNPLYENLGQLSNFDIINNTRMLSQGLLIILFGLFALAVGITLGFVDYHDVSEVVENQDSDSNSSSQ
jgi:hypothetical protein